jgi:hypothetical protein
MIDQAERSDRFDRFDGAARPDGRGWRSSRPRAVPVELLVGGRRLVGRASEAALAGLGAAIARGPVRIGGAGRYGPFWTLTFEGHGRPLVVLADQVALLPSAGEVADGPRLPERQLAG